MPTTTETPSLYNRFVEHPLVEFYGFSVMAMAARAPAAGFNVPWTGLPARIANMATGAFARGAKRPGLATQFPAGGIGMGSPRFRRRLMGDVKFGIKPAGFYKSRRGVLALTGRLGRTQAPAMRMLIGKNLLARAAGFGLTMIGIELAMMVPMLAYQGYRGIVEQVKSTRGLEMGGYFPETRGSLTSRQRSVQAITDSRLQARSAIGNEAQLFHR